MSASALNDAGKEVVVQACLLVAAADGRVSPDGAKLLAGILQTLETLDQQLLGNAY